ncbi:MAG: hypothetical protein NXI16_09820 [Alphaproteobacteria bacterium]|nr:hypothetical protein [Alphaproteobacteria bacterium]
MRKKSNAKPIAVIMLLGLGFFVLPTLILFLVSMAPTLITYVMDRRSEKYAAFSVGCMNFCGTLPYALDLWLNDHSIDQTGFILSDPLAWIVMYGAAGVGWGIHMAAPRMISVVLRFHTERRIEKLKEYQRDLVAEWGKDITRNGEDDEFDIDDDGMPPDTAPLADDDTGQRNTPAVP